MSGPLHAIDTARVMVFAKTREEAAANDRATAMAAAVIPPQETAAGDQATKMATPVIPPEARGPETDDASENQRTAPYNPAISARLFGRFWTKRAKREVS